jgi:hypothetical protein
MVIWSIKLAFKLISRLWLVALSVVAGMTLAFYIQLRELHRSWGVEPADTSRALRGDELVANPDIIETRSLVVNAPPSEVWPWLAQMGFGRGGWYSYDQLDMKGSSARRILPEYQALAEGDIVPTHPGGGFVARAVDPDNALVLYLDHELVKDQMESSVGQKGREALGDIEEDSDDDMPGGLQFAGALGDMTMPEFRASWAFILESEAGGKTRLIERLRVWTTEGGLPQRLGMPVMGLGVFAMTRKHMLGVKERAEASTRNGAGHASAATEV